ncbi:hypothetical protein AVEN_155624-1 [Araneus ventricosus]|uniref:Retrovirus-related Pol polyprotein from type-1 retrotransposable element R1 n=1 Tax=Araneus ventricosus TaxID=182803 RepID=A0A4Y2WBV7_ARAVE|nr:hypothetical protein AVEN_164979-1 [Araneus ventricosus]GBO34709.1 hypothetical protein AVEN_155624-1 [Araneus ventricosus]
MQTSEGTVLWEQTQGCPQGSCSGPAFWNIVADEILSVQWPQGVHLQAFADDFAFIVTDNTREGLRKLSKLALDKFKEWADKNKLHVSVEKSSYVLFSKLVRGPTIKRRNQSISQNHIDSGAKAVYTDGSKTDEGTGSAYCILENYGIIVSRQGKLDRSNSAFQAEILAIRMAIEAASSLHRPIKIWTDSLSSLMAILNPKSHHSMVREIQTLLLSHKHIYLRWLKAYVGYLGSECADQLAKEAITKENPFLLPKPLSYLKS